jgi:membrane protease YdiL (CAAX protease family)
MASMSPTRRDGLRGYFRRVNLLTSVLLVFPLFLVYQVGVLTVPEVHNGADLVTSELLALLRGRVGVYVLVNLGLGVAFVIAVLVLRRKNEFNPRLFLPLVVESALYALSMGSLILFVMQDILHVPPGLTIAAAAGPAGVGNVGLAGKIVLAFGAGVHEELVFRLLLIPALAAFAHKLLGLTRGWAVALAFVGSSLLFSAAHHVIGGEPWRVGVFTYRVLCGLFFATLFQVRGFAVAVYTHALYDVFVLVLHG